MGVQDCGGYIHTKVEKQYLEISCREILDLLDACRLEKAFCRPVWRMLRMENPPAMPLTGVAAPGGS